MFCVELKGIICVIKYFGDAMLRDNGEVWHFAFSSLWVCKCFLHGIIYGFCPFCDHFQMLKNQRIRDDNLVLH